MAQGFTDPLDVRLLDAERRGRVVVKTLAPFTYHVGRKGSADRITVPAGFETDFASTPRWSWPLVPPLGRYARAAALHDYLYETQTRPRAEADRIFAEAMGVARVPAALRIGMWAAVRLFGGRAWRKESGGKPVGQADAPQESPQNQRRHTS